MLPCTLTSTLNFYSHFSNSFLAVTDELAVELLTKINNQL